MVKLNQWPIGAKVKTTVPLMGTVETGRDEMGLVTTAPGIVVQAGSVGVVEDHYDDGRILVTFECDTLRGHTFAKPERYLELTDESQPNAYDMIERLTRMQIVPATPAEYRAGQETIKAAIRVIGELADEVERLRATNARLVAACKTAVEWFEVYADEYPDHGRKVEVGLMVAVEQIENEAADV